MKAFKLFLLALVTLFAATACSDDEPKPQALDFSAVVPGQYQAIRITKLTGVDNLIDTIFVDVQYSDGDMRLTFAQEDSLGYVFNANIVEEGLVGFNFEVPRQTLGDGKFIEGMVLEPNSEPATEHHGSFFYEESTQKAYIDMRVRANNFEVLFGMER